MCVNVPTCELDGATLLERQDSFPPGCPRQALLPAACQMKFVTDATNACPSDREA